MQTLAEWLNRKPKGKAPRKRIPKMSSKRQREARIYSVKRKAFLEAHPTCQAYMTILWGAPVGLTPGKDGWLDNIPPPPASEIHHREHRTGKNYLDSNTWLAVSPLSHRWIHRHGDWARKLGLLK